jgi:hypothetical protein
MYFFHHHKFCSAKCHIRSFYIINLLLGVLFFNLFFDVLLMDLLMELRKYNCGPILMTHVGYLGVIYGPVNNFLYIDVVRSNTTADVVYCVVQATAHILRHHNFVVNGFPILHGFKRVEVAIFWGGATRVVGLPWYGFYPTLFNAMGVAFLIPSPHTHHPP